MGNSHTASHPARTSRAVFALAFVSSLSLPVVAAAQYWEASTVTCASSNGQRTFCTADTRNGVRLIREFGRGRCDEGSTWGFTEQGIWVDRGCEAEFAIGPAEPPVGDRDQIRGYYDEGGRLTQIAPGTVITVRTTEPIDADRDDGRMYSGLIERDVPDTNGRVAILRGESVELATRRVGDNQLVLDLDSVTVDGERYAVRADAERVRGAEGTRGVDKHTGEYVGGGALLGTLLGAAIGGGKGAAIGAAAGAAAGVEGALLTNGTVVRVPRNSILTFRLERPLEVGIADPGYMRDGRHYHPRER